MTSLEVKRAHGLGMRDSSYDRMLHGALRAELLEVGQAIRQEWGWPISFKSLSYKLPGIFELARVDYMELVHGVRQYEIISPVSIEGERFRGDIKGLDENRALALGALSWELKRRYPAEYARRGRGVRKFDKKNIPWKEVVATAKKVLGNDPLALYINDPVFGEGDNLASQAPLVDIIDDAETAIAEAELEAFDPIKKIPVFGNKQTVELGAWDRIRVSVLKREIPNTTMQSVSPTQNMPFTVLQAAMFIRAVSIHRLETFNPRKREFVASELRQALEICEGYMEEMQNNRPPKIITITCKELFAAVSWAVRQGRYI